MDNAGFLKGTNSLTWEIRMTNSYQTS